MNLTEKISYIRGLCDGLELDESKPEVKVLNATLIFLMIWLLKYLTWKNFTMS